MLTLTSLEFSVCYKRFGIVAAWLATGQSHEDGVFEFWGWIFMTGQGVDVDWRARLSHDGSLNTGLMVQSMGATG